MRCAYCNQEFDGVGVKELRDTRKPASHQEGHQTETEPVWICRVCAARRNSTRVGLWLLLAALIAGMILIAAIVPIVQAALVSAGDGTSANEWLSARAGSGVPAGSPNPHKAPWYFSGPAEWLVYANPWFAGTLVFFIAGAIVLVVVVAAPLVIWLVLRAWGK